MYVLNTFLNIISLFQSRVRFSGAGDERQISEMPINLFPWDGESTGRPIGGDDPYYDNDEV